MPINAKIDFQLARDKFEKAETVQDKLKCAQEMLSTAPKHKGTGELLKEIKTKISKYRAMIEKEKSQKRGAKSKFSFKKEGVATICLVGAKFSGKTGLLSKLANMKNEGLNIGIVDYYGIKLQLIEIPSIQKNFIDTKNCPALLGIMRSSNLIILFFNNPDEKQLLDSELSEIEDIPKLIYNNQENILDLVWKKLKMIKVYTKQPGKEKEYPPLALKENSTVKNFALHIHKDFAKNLTFARVWGDSAKFEGMRVNLNHILKDNDIVELHLK